jgi:hypothetical protein
MINLGVFFKSVRVSVFHGSLTKGQVDGMERIIDYWQTQWPKMPVDEFAYLLATVAHETAYKMQPVKEGGGDRYLRSKRYYPYVGVGLIQATWKRNWDILGIKSVEDGLQWPTALYAAFYGMDAGIYTGKRLSDYIGHGRIDYVNARRIINGTDRAEDIAKIAKAFRSALLQSIVEEKVPDVPIPLPPEKPVADYDQFRKMLIRALEEDPDIRGLILAIAFPEEPEPSDEELGYDDTPHEDYGSDQPEYAYADEELDQRYA